MSDNAQIDWRLILSEPLDVKDVADLFRTTPRHVAALMADIPGVQRCGRRYQIPIGRLPVEYWVDAGIIDRPKPEPIGSR